MSRAAARNVLPSNVSVANTVTPTRESVLEASVPFHRRLRRVPGAAFPSQSVASPLVGAVTPKKSPSPAPIPKFDPKRMVKVITWNVAGLRSLVKKPTAGGKAPLGGGENKKNPLQVLVDTEKPDVLCLQETKLNPDGEETNHLIAPFSGYTFKDSISRERKGYSGTRTYVKDPQITPPTAPKAGKNTKVLDSNLTWWYGTSFKKPSEENPFGRVLSCRWRSMTSPQPSKKSTTPPLDQLTVVNTYVVNAGDELQRLDHKVKEFTPELGSFIGEHLKAESHPKKESSMGTKNRLAAKLIQARTTGGAKSKGLVTEKDIATSLEQASKAVKSNSLVVWTGDFNCAPQDWDRYWSRDFDLMETVAGFTPQEKASLKATLADLKMVDAFSALYPNSREAYTFWSYRFNRRQLDEGWRLDGFMVPQKDMWRVVDVFPLKEVMGSDHCPVVMWLWK